MPRAGGSRLTLSLVIEAVIWDVGGVLLPHAGSAPGRDRWRQRFGLSIDDFHSRVWASMGSCGEAEIDTITRRLAAEFALSRVDATALLHDYHSHWQPDRELLEFAASLRGTVAIGVLANAAAAARWGFEALMQLHVIADDIVISAEIGIDKPDRRAYEIALQRLDRNAEHCVFVDDRLDNIQAAERVGMTGLIHKDRESTIKALRRLLGARART